jgi:membrane protein YqaA with SNARE-associated domain
MLMWLGVSLGVAFGSAVLPLISVELFLIGLVTQQPQIPWLLLGAVIAIGQVAGKLVHYFAARGSLRLPDVMRLPAFLRRRARGDRGPSPRRERWALRTKRVRASAARLTERCHRHPHWMFGTYGMSSLVGMPPFMGTTILAGLVRMNLTAFVSAGLIGRFIRFSALAAAPAWCSGWLF